MDGPLWTATHAPTIEELPQPAVRDALERAVDEPMNLVVHGPQGAGKTAAVRALARASHETPDADFMELNVADFFDRTKSDLRDDPRFEPFLRGQTAFSKQYRRGTSKRNKYKSDWSKRDMLAHVLKELASYQPSAGAYKTILLDNAERIREDFQQALRRVIERYHRATRFVIATRQPSKLIPAIRSRCFDVPVRAPTHEEIVTVCRRIADREAVTYDEDGLEYVASYAQGDLRRALLAIQTTAVREGEVTMAAAHEVLSDVGPDAAVAEMLTAAEEGRFGDARSALDDLLFDQGYDGEEILETILSVARSRYGDVRLARLHALAGAVDVDLAEGTTPRVHLGRLLAELGREAGN